MAIRFQCNTCANPFVVPEEMAGTRARCNGCGAIVMIPSQVGAEVPGLIPLGPAPKTQRPVRGIIRPARQEFSAVPIVVWVLGAAGGLLVLCIIAAGLGIAMLMPSGNDSPPAVATGETEATPQSKAVAEFDPTPKPAPRASTAASSNRPSNESASTPKAFESPTQLPSDATEESAASDEEDENAKTRARVEQAQREAETRLAEAKRRAQERRDEIMARAGVTPPPSSRDETSNTDRADEAPSSEAVGWRAQPDPANLSEIKRGKISIDVPSSSDIIFPPRPSNFVLVKAGNFNDEVRQVFDLRTASSIGKPVKGKLNIHSYDQAFSPDGRYMAAELSVTGVTAYGIWSFNDGQMVREVSLVEGTRGGIHFGAPHQLVMFSTKHGEKPSIEVLDVRSGATVRKFDVEAERYAMLTEDETAISNGGKYFVAVIDQKVAVYELASGQRVGQLELPVKSYHCDGLAFSHDGEELAIIGTEGAGSRLFCIEFDTGRVDLDHTYEQRLSASSRGPVLEYMPDRTALLYEGSLVLDRRSGAVLWTFPSTGGSGRRILRPGKMLVSMRRSGKRNDVLTEVELPEKALAAAAEAVQGGGEAVDAALPPLTTADTFSATAITLPNGFVQWSASPDPEPAMQRDIDRAVPIASARDFLQNVRFASRSSGKVLVHMRVGGRQDALEQVDLYNGRKSKPMPIPSVYKLLDVSPSGGSALIGFEEGNRYGDRGFSRLDLVEFRPNKHIAGWRPHAGEAEGSRDEGFVAWATFLDDARIITVNKAGKLTLWQMPDCKAIYHFEQFGEPLAVSPGRKYFAGVHEGGFRIFDSATGKCVGDLESPRTGIKALRGAFDPEGEFLVAIIEDNMDRLLVRWDMKSGQLTQEFPVKSELLFSLGRGWFGRKAGLEWRGDRYLMLDEQYLIDLENEAVVWRYHMQGSHYATGSPDGKSWLVGRQQLADSPWFLKAHDTPSLLTKAKTDFMTKEKQLVLAPGMKVRIHVDLSSVQLQSMEGNVAEALAEAFATRGIEEDKTNGTVFSLVAGKKSTGETISVRDGTKVTGSFSREKLAVKLTLFDATRTPRWQRETGVQMRSYGWVKTNDARGEVAQEMYDAFKRMLTTGGLATEGVPTYIFADLEEMLAGESSLSFSGEGPPPTRSKSTSSSTGSSFSPGTPSYVPRFPSRTRP